MELRPTSCLGRTKYFVDAIGRNLSGARRIMKPSLLPITEGVSNTYIIYGFSVNLAKYQSDEDFLVHD